MLFREKVIEAWASCFLARWMVGYGSFASAESGFWGREWG